MRLSIAVVLLFSCAGLSQNAPDAKALLKGTDNALRDLKSYVIEQKVTVQITGGTASSLEMPVTLAASSPGKLRIESNSQLGSSLIVSDGENTWIYIGPLRQYTKTPAASSPEALMKSINLGISQMLEGLKAKDPYLSARVTGEEILEVSGKKFECFVVEAVLDKINLPASMALSGGVMTMWIDKPTKLTLKQTATGSMEGGPLATPAQMVQSTTVTSLKLNEALPDSLFTFTPPEGAREVAEFNGPTKPTPDLTGKTAAEFTLTSLDGAQYSLPNLRGKTVLLDFWATWCIPCRNDMPALQKIYQDFHSKGLVMLGMDVGEDQDTVGKFLSGTNLNYPIVLAGDSDVVQRYSVTAFPTIVLIDSKGEIALYHIGAGGDSELRAALARLGLSTSSGANVQ